MARFEEIGVRAVAEGVENLIFKLGLMNKAMKASGLAGAGAAGGISAMSLALGALVVGAAAAITAVGVVTAGLISLGKRGVETAASMESAFAGVLKTTRGLGTNLFDLTEAGERVFQEFRDMTKEIPLTFEELADIGQLVGQLGVAEEEIVGVTEVIAALGVSTNLSIQDAALVVSRFATVMSETGDVTTEQFQRISSALVFLGNNFKARESEIILTARNIAGTASLFGFSEAAVLALGTAVVEAGVSSEAGGSAIQNTLTTINTAVLKGGEALDTFAETAGVSAEEFASLWKTDAQEAFVSFIEGLRSQGAEGVLTLDELDLAQRRSIRTLLGISKASINLRDIVTQSTEAYEANTALTREAEIRYATFDSQVQILKNRFRDMGLTIGMELIPRLLELFDKIDPIITALEENLEPAVKQVSDTIFEKLVPALENLLKAFGVDLSEEGLVTGIESLGDTISTHIENFSIFVDKIAELVALSREKGLAGFFEGLGVPEELAPGFADAAVAIGAFVLAVKGIGAASIALAGLSAVFTTGFIANVGAFFAIVGEAGLAASIGLLINPITGLAAAIGALIVTVASLDEEDIQMFKGLGEQLQTISELLPMAIEAKEKQQEKAILEWLSGVKDAIINFFTVTLPESVKEISAGISLWAKNVVADMSTFFSETFPEFVTNVAATIGEVVLAVAEYIRDQMIKFWNQVWPDIRNAFREAGKKIISGFIAGIKSKVQAAIDAIKKAAQDINAAAEGEFGITSPSRVFAEMGKDVMKGLQMGIEKMAIAPQMSIASAMGKMVSAGAQSVPMSTTTTSSVDRSFNYGDLIFNTKPESPATVGFTLQRLALMQQGAS